jgi:CheY-like chemotaxis protein
MKDCNLLLIDDDELCNLLVNTFIKDMAIIKNYKIECSGWDALTYLEECLSQNQFPDLIIVDLNMPEMHGFDFIEHFEKKFPAQINNTKIMVMTNSILEKDKNQSLQYQSVAGFINKPLIEEMLEEIIQEL